MYWRRMQPVSLGMREPAERDDEKKVLSRGAGLAQGPGFGPASRRPVEARSPLSPTADLAPRMRRPPAGARAERYIGYRPAPTAVYPSAVLAPVLAARIPGAGLWSHLQSPSGLALHSPHLFFLSSGLLPVVSKTPPARRGPTASPQRTASEPSSTPSRCAAINAQ